MMITLLTVDDPKLTLLMLLPKIRVVIEKIKRKN